MATSAHLVQDFFSTIEEAGISDIAAEVGILPENTTTVAEVQAEGRVSENGVEPSSVTGSALADSLVLPCSILTARAFGRLDEPSFVNMSYPSPQVPDGLAGTLGLVGGEPAAKKKRTQRTHGGKQGDKGLRHFSMKVCEKVEQKGKTTYNEVADELVAQFGEPSVQLAPLSSR